MRKIIQGVRNFQATVFRQQRELFESLAKKKQSPIALFITCSDSRINPNLLTSTEPGDLFLIRNAGNIVPPFGAANGGEGATVEYAVSVLRTPNIIVCGHYGCGAMHYLMRMDNSDDLTAVRSWCSHAEATRRITKERYKDLPEAARDDAAIETNVLVQIDNLQTHPSVLVAQACGRLNIYGWVYRIETGEVRAFDPATRSFQPLGETEPTPFRFGPQLSAAPLS